MRDRDDHVVRRVHDAARAHAGVVVGRWGENAHAVSTPKPTRAGRGGRAPCPEKESPAGCVGVGDGAGAGVVDVVGSGVQVVVGAGGVHVVVGAGGGVDVVVGGGGVELVVGGGGGGVDEVVGTSAIDDEDGMDCVVEKKGVGREGQRRWREKKKKLQRARTTVELSAAELERVRHDARLTPPEPRLTTPPRGARASAGVVWRRTAAWWPGLRAWWPATVPAEAERASAASRKTFVSANMAGEAKGVWW